MPPGGDDHSWNSGWSGGPGLLTSFRGLGHAALGGRHCSPQVSLGRRVVKLGAWAVKEAFRETSIMQSNSLTSPVAPKGGERKPRCN